MKYHCKKINGDNVIVGYNIRRRLNRLPNNMYIVLYWTLKDYFYEQAYYEYEDEK